jgi:hypothetical protein
METSEFVDFIRLIARRDVRQVARRLRACPDFATAASPIGASRQAAEEFVRGRYGLASGGGRFLSAGC